MDTTEDLRTPEQLVADFRSLLEVERIGEDLFRGARQPGGVGRVFGGQVIAQGLVAATSSVVPERVVHSLHAYFLRGGDETIPIVYRVIHDFDGGSFSNRRIVAFQNGQPILSMTASFQVPEDGLGHQSTMPDTPPPETLPDEQAARLAIADSVPERFRPWFLRRRPFETRFVDGLPWLETGAREAYQRVWFRAVAPLGEDKGLHRAMLAYISDLYLLGTSTRPHGVDWMAGTMQTASLDHAVWFHAPVDLDDWLLYVTESPWAGGGRGFARGKLYARDGRLVASVAQEGLIRRRSLRG